MGRTTAILSKSHSRATGEAPSSLHELGQRRKLRAWSRQAVEIQQDRHAYVRTNVEQTSSVVIETRYLDSTNWSWTRLISQSEVNEESRSTDQSASRLFVWLLSCFCYAEKTRSNAHIPHSLRLVQAVQYQFRRGTIEARSDRVAGVARFVTGHMDLNNFDLERLLCQ
jgi:hypothetical protein